MKETYIALFRGINVGGKNTLPMKTLVSILEKNDCTNVRTYIQSGNVVFQSDSQAAELFKKSIASMINDECGFTPQIIVIHEDLFESIAESNPFKEAQVSPKSVHVYFLAYPPKEPDIERLNVLRTPSETFEISDTAFYLLAPDGIGKSKLAAQAEKLLGVPATTRNWNTVSALRAMLKA